MNPKKFSHLLHAVAAAGVFTLGTHASAAVFMANGIKIGDATQDSVILWTRLTQHAERNVNGRPFPQFKFADETSEARQLEGHALEEMEGAVPGAAGEVRFVYWADGEKPAAARATPWTRVDAARDFTARAAIGQLRPATPYRLRAEGRTGPSGAAECVTEGVFRYALAPSAAADAVVVRLQKHGADYPIIFSLGAVQTAPPGIKFSRS